MARAIRIVAESRALPDANRCHEDEYDANAAAYRAKTRSGKVGVRFGQTRVALALAGHLAHHCGLGRRHGTLWHSLGTSSGASDDRKGSLSVEAVHSTFTVLSSM
jgi:hypothetical protein